MKRSQAWAERRWELLAEFTYRWDELSGHPDFRGCKSCEGAACAGRAYRIPPLKFKDWPACPRQLLSDPAWLSASSEYQASLVSPLDGWTHGYVAWAVDAITALRTEGEKHKVRQFEARTESKSGQLPPVSQSHTAKRAARGPRREG